MKHIFTCLLLGCWLLQACDDAKPEVKSGLPVAIFKIDGRYVKYDTTGDEGLAIRFYSNGTYSHFGYKFYAYGNWRWNENTRMVSLTPANNKDTTAVLHYKIDVDDDGEYSIKKMVKVDDYIYKKRSPCRLITAKNAEEADPFSKDMNTWRIRPEHIETKTEIRQRTLDYLKFLQCYYEFLQDNQLNNYSTMWYATPIQLQYGNGVRMSYVNELDDWYACFFNVEQANDAYKLIAGAMRKATIDFNDKFIYKRNLAYLKQLIKAIA